MRVLSRRKLREYFGAVPDAERGLTEWYRMMKSRAYLNPHEVRRDFASVSFLRGNRTVFNIGGNKYRLIVDIRYDLGMVFVREVLTHEEYDARRGTL